MKPKSLVITGLIIIFFIGITLALLQEVQREEQEVGSAISGVVEISPALWASGTADIVKTDRIVLFLVDPQTRQPVAMRTDSPFVPPQTIRVGQNDVRGNTQLQGSYFLVGIHDKDGEIFKVTPGEVYGISKTPVPIGSEQYRLSLDQPFRGSLFNEGAPGLAGGNPPAASQPPGDKPPMAEGAQGPPRPLNAPPEGDPRYTIQGTITVSNALKNLVEPGDRLLIMLFDPEMARPVAFKMIPHTLLPQAFSISLPPDQIPSAKPAYMIRALTDKNNSPFESAEGEIIGRSSEPIPLGTTGLQFELDQPYIR